MQQSASVEDLITANKLLHYAIETKDRGVHFPADAFDFDKAAILSINDASHAASFEASDSGKPVGHRSQSGRILAFGSQEGLETGKGKIHMLQWTSTVIKRVCRSTLQAEALSLQLGSEDAEHLRQMMYVLKNGKDHLNRQLNYIAGMDATTVGWFTDCRSLSDHLTNPNSCAISDKRLAIDLTSLRQELWRQCGQLVGNPTYLDGLPKNRTTFCWWVSTHTMASDSLTKHMKSVQMDNLMRTGVLQMEYEAAHAHRNSYGCEIEHELA